MIHSRVLWTSGTSSQKSEIDSSICYTRINILDTLAHFLIGMKAASSLKGANMIPWTPTRPAPPPQQWQSREEILKAHLDSLSPDELRRVRPDYYWLRFGLAAAKRNYARKYDPDQPRVPAGNPDGGQWTNGGGSAGQTTDFSGARRKRSEAYCWNQMQIDMLLCASLHPASRVAACRGQAMERYAACLTGKPIPPLPF
jgi:hypothetical protein